MITKETVYKVCGIRVEEAVRLIMTDNNTSMDMKMNLLGSLICDYADSFAKDVDKQGSDEEVVKEEEVTLLDLTQGQRYYCTYSKCGVGTASCQVCKEFRGFDKETKMLSCAHTDCEVEC